MPIEATCPFKSRAGGGPSNRDWWPNELDLEVLHQHSPLSDPMGRDFDYASSDAQAKFVQDFVAAWSKVMNLDRFDRA